MRPSDQPVVVLFGGPSREAKVSLASAQSVISALAESRPLSAWFWGPEGGVWAVGPETVLRHQGLFVEAFSPTSAEPTYASLVEAAQSEAGRAATWFLAVHGIGCEDGSLQAQLDAAGVAYTGSSAAASTWAFDKILARQRLSGSGLQVADGVVITELSSAQREVARAALERFGAAVLKPAREGSSFGVHFLEGPSDLDAVFDQLAATEAPWLFEEQIFGRELTVSVCDGPRGLEALVPSEVLLEAGRRFDYEGKYLGQGSTEITPAKLSAEETEAAQRVGLQAHLALSARGYSRTDMILRDDGTLVVLELNTLPGLSSASFLPQQWAAMGRDLGDFVREQLALVE